MAFCRWSDMDFHCELYCYEDSRGGFTTHVAAVRLNGQDQKTPIGLPYDGETFHDTDIQAFRARIAHLIETGYRAPDGLLDEIDKEMKAI